MAYKKTIGTLLPLSALNPHASISDALNFVDWLKKNHQSAWQFLPLHETHLLPGSKTTHVASPYKGYGIGLDPKYVGKFEIRNSKFETNQFKTFKWLFDYAFFCALRDFFGTDNWTTWDEDVRRRKSDVLDSWQTKLSQQIDHYINQQITLHDSYKQLRQKAKKENVLLVGDLPFYLPLQSPLTWIYQHVFCIDENGFLPRVSGVPNEPKATYGRQVWGHPLYRWDIPELHSDIVQLFNLRLDYLSDLFDMVRFDHANGLFLYGSIDPKQLHNDRLLHGPGFPVFKAIIEHTRKTGLTIFAEDAAVHLDQLRKAMKTLNVPGIKIVRYAYNNKVHKFEKDYVDLSKYPANAVVYTSTHDTETLVGFLDSLNIQEKQALAKKIKITYTQDNRTFARHMRQAVINSPAHMVIIPIQDWLLSADRINIPGTESDNDPNWQYKLPGSISKLRIT